MEVPIHLQYIILHTGIMYCMNLCHSKVFWKYYSGYVPLPLFVFPIVLIVFIPMFFLFFPSSCILYTYFLVHIIPGFAFSQLCVFYPRLDENFWGVYAYVFHHMQLYVHFEICILNIIYHI